MQIECTTIHAAAQVLFILVDAHLRPGGEFHITGSRPPDPPIRFTLRKNLPVYVMRRLRATPDTLIVGETAGSPHLRASQCPRLL